MTKEESRCWSVTDGWVPQDSYLADTTISRWLNVVSESFHKRVFSLSTGAKWLWLCSVFWVFMKAPFHCDTIHIQSWELDASLKLTPVGFHLGDSWQYNIKHRHSLAVKFTILLLPQFYRSFMVMDVLWCHYINMTYNAISNLCIGRWLM